MASRILPAEQATTATAWQVPVVGVEPPPLRGGGVADGIVRASVLEDLQREAYDEAFRQGYRDGQVAAQREAAVQVQRLAALLDDLARPFAELDASVEEELLALALALAKQLVRRELRVDPTQVIGVVREALAALPVAAREVRVQLHPDDAAIVREHLAPTVSERAWVIVEDPMMMRGGCRVLAQNSRIDASFEKRLGEVVADLLGDERHGQRGGQEPA